MHQPAVASSSRHACGAGVLAAFASGHQQFDGAPDLRGVLFQRNAFLKVDQPLKALENLACATTSSVAAKSSSVSPGNPTMRSVVMAACGMAARTRSMMPRYLSAR